MTLPDTLEARVRGRTSAKVRLVMRRDAADTTIEPFVGSASIAALLGIARKRAGAVEVLAAIVSELRAEVRDVRVVRRAEGEPEPAIVEAGVDSLADAIARTPCNVRVVA